MLATGSVVAVFAVCGWLTALIHLRLVVMRRYDRCLADTGLSVAQALSMGGTIGGVVAAAVRYNPFAFIVSTYDTAEEAERRLAAMGWRLLHWHRPNPTAMLCIREGEAVLAFRGTETPEDAAANRNVWGTAHAVGGARFRLHRGLRGLLAGYLGEGGALAAPAFRAALRSAAAVERLTVVGYSLGGSLAVGLSVLLRNPRFAEAFGLPIEAVTGLLADAGGAGVAVHCVAYACPAVFRFGSGIGVDGPDLRNIVTIVKEGDAVPLLSLANILGSTGLPFPADWALHQVGPVLVVSDEEWRGHDIPWLTTNRTPLPAVRLFYIAADDSARHRELLGRAALLRAAPVAFQGLTLVRPLHSHERWRTTVDEVAVEARAAGHPLPSIPAGVAD